MKNNEILYECATWVGMLGVFTGMKPNKFSISINFRGCGDSFLWNLLSLMLGNWTLGSFVRYICENAQTYEQAVQMAKKSYLIAPCYIIIAGCNDKQGIVISRNRFTVNHISFCTILFFCFIFLFRFFLFFFAPYFFCFCFFVLG